MTFTMQHTLRALRTGWYLILLGALVAAGAAVMVEQSASLVFEASASYVVSPGSQVAPDDVAQGVDTLDSSRSRSIMTTLTEITDSDAVRSEAFAALDLPTDLIDNYSVESIVVPEANVMETIVTGPDPSVAAALTSSLGTIGGARFVRLYQIYDVVTLDPAEIPTEPSNPGLGQLLVIAITLGIMAGGAAALLRSAVAERSGRRTMDRRLGAYHGDVTHIEQHERFKRTG
jgi:uncharacterized protein involved in exopolysaccharide biosynthesis